MCFGMRKPSPLGVVSEIIFLESWLGRQDSNLGMSVPKTDALPLGDAPTAAFISEGGMGPQGGKWANLGFFQKLRDLPFRRGLA